MSKDQPDQGLEKIVTASGLHVYGTPVVDLLGNKIILHESSVPEEEGGPFIWLTLQRAGETEGVGVLLDANLADLLLERFQSARSDTWGTE